ncbi:TolC family protein [Yeosuana marina]|uniref:TolC family protein n=1 Tax=Yeosuana marina TaxID=1565536 RepID=UPI0030EBB294|tara:strand:+ start:1054 stop:2370 length:1317 start_codon:yes stop_codon:yes gene_type:complete
MKIKIYILVCFLSISSLKAQETEPLTIQEAVSIALKNSDASKIADTKVSSAESELNVTKNLQYPDVKLSGQYLYLTNANVNLKISTGETSSNSGNGSTPKVNQLLLGQANVTMPLFSGFKLKNTIKASDNLYKAATFSAKNDKEQLSVHVINDFLNLYKAAKTIDLIQENLKSAHQRVIDFSAMEQNGLLARNDLLKAQLQESSIQLSLDEAKKNKRILNYRLATLLKLPKNTQIETLDPDFNLVSNQTAIESDLSSRGDLESLHYQEEASKNQIKVAKSKYFPSLALTGGYIALDLQNALTVNNAMNVGLGISYNLSDIFKAKSDIKLAKSKTQELEYTINMVSDQIKVEIENAKEDYELALKNYNVYSESEIQASENYRIVKDKYDNGLMDTNDLLEADVDQLQAKLNVTYAKANISQKYYELLSAQGQLISSINN